MVYPNRHVTTVSMYVSCSAKTRGLRHLQLLDMVARIGLKNRACIVHRRTDELLR
jgi:hypothetical protein